MLVSIGCRRVWAYDWRQNPNFLLHLAFCLGYIVELSVGARRGAGTVCSSYPVCLLMLLVPD